MEILNFGQLSLAPESKKLPLFYAVLNNISVEKIGIIQPADYSMSRFHGYGKIHISESYKLKREMDWSPYSKVVKDTWGLNNFYLSVSKDELFNKIREELNYIDDSIKSELRERRAKHNTILKSLHILEQYGK